MLNYSDKLLSYFRQDEHVGSLNEADPRVTSVRVGVPRGGDQIYLQIQLNEENTIERAVFKAHGSAALIAVAAYLCEFMEAKQLDDLQGLSSQKIISALDLPPQRHHCAILAEEAIQLLYGSDCVRKK